MSKSAEFDNVSEVGGELLSEPLLWLLRTVAKDVYPVRVMMYSLELPQNEDGDSVYADCFPSIKGMALNLEHHFQAALWKIQDKESHNTSIRFFLIKSLIDSVIHEALHLKGMDDEEAIVQKANQLSWVVGENTDVDIRDLGAFFENEINILVEGWREDVLEPDCKEFKKIQLHCEEHRLAFYDPEKHIEVQSIRQAMMYEVNPEHPWMSTDATEFRTYYVDGCREKFEEGSPEQTNVPAPFIPATPAPPVTQQAATQAAPIRQEYVGNDPLSYSNEPDYDPFDDATTEYVFDFDDEPQKPMGSQSQPIPIPAIQQAPTAQPQAPAVQQPAAPQNQQTDQVYVQRLLAIGEKVLRRLFHNVQMKCEFNTAGGYNNPAAVLEPISIQDIEGANELFVSYDAPNEMGKWRPNVPANGFLKGSISKAGLPQYKMTLNIGGNNYKRTFIANNPHKTDANGNPTKWAAEAQSGIRIMALLGEIGTSPIAFIRLPAGLPPGQEEFCLWDKR